MFLLPRIRDTDLLNSIRRGNHEFVVGKYYQLLIDQIIANYFNIKKNSWKNYLFSINWSTEELLLIPFDHVEYKEHIYYIYVLERQNSKFYNITPNFIFPTTHK